jgi:quinol monooxygenase YgiN
MDVMTIEWHATPFRADRFLEGYQPALRRALAYGASGYLFYRSEEDPDLFVHISYWENRGDFQRYWLSQEMQQIRENIAGLHGQPVAPHWSYLLDRT